MTRRMRMTVRAVRRMLVAVTAGTVIAVSAAATALAVVLMFR